MTEQQRPQAGPDLIVWRTQEPIPLTVGSAQAGGTAWPQIRSPRRLAALGDAEAQRAYIRNTILGALVRVLPSVQDEDGRWTLSQGELASVLLVAANQQLAATGVVLLDLAVEELVLIPQARNGV